MRLTLLPSLAIIIIAALSETTSAQTPPGSHVSLNGSSQFLSFTSPGGSRQVREISSRMVSARIGHGTDQVLFDWTGVGTLYVKAASLGVTNLQFVPASGTGTTTVNITSFTVGFIYRFQYRDIGPNMAYSLEAWNAKGDTKSHVFSTTNASAGSLDPNNRAVRIGAKQDGTLHLQANVDFWRWHDSWISFDPASQSPYPTFAKNWLACWCINGNENWLDFNFEGNLNNGTGCGALAVTMSATGSPTFSANSNTAPTAVGEDRTEVTKGRIPLNATLSFDYDSPPLLTLLSDTLSSNWTCVSAPGGGCGVLTIRQPTRLFTWVDGATATGTYTFTFAVTDGSLTDSDTVTIEVVSVSASLGDTACFVDEPCLLDATSSTGWDEILVDTGETVPGSALKYNMRIPRSVHRYTSVGIFTATVTASDAQPVPVTAQDTATVTVTARPEADAANTEDLTSPANINHISAANCTGDPTGNLTKVQNAVDIARSRNTVAQLIIVPAGCRANGGGGTQLLLRTPVSTSMITIQSSGTLPSGHKRITPAEADQLFTLRATSSNIAAVATETSSHHYKLRGLIFETSVNTFSIVDLGNATTEDTANKISHHIIVQHCIVRPTNEFSVNVQHALILNANDVSVIDSYFEPNSFSGVESHNIVGWSSEGRHVVSNNYLGGASINYIYGGARSTVSGMVVSDVEVRENHFWKPPEWRPSNPAWDGKTRGVKNLFELKTGSYLVMAGNILENNWTDAQAGRGVILQATCDSGNWAAANYLDYSYNTLNNSERGINIRGTEYRGVLQSQKLWLTNNLFENMDAQPIVLTQTSGVRFNHCTFTFEPDRSATFDGEMRSAGFIWENSIIFEGAFGWFGGSVGLASLNKFTPGFIFEDSLQVSGSLSNYGPPISDVQFPVNEAAVGFTGTGIWSLGPSSPYRGDANDGTDPGVNWPHLQAYQAHVVDGNWLAVAGSVNLRGRATVRGKVVIK